MGESPPRVNEISNYKSIFRDPARKATLQWAVGLLREREVQWDDFDNPQEPHLAILGDARMGKSMAVKTMLIQLLRANTPRWLELVLIDPSDTHSKFATVAHLQDWLTVNNPTQGVQPVHFDPERFASQFVNIICRSRDELFVRQGLAPKQQALSPKRLIIIEEAHSIVRVLERSTNHELLERYREAFARLVSEGPSVGIHLVVISTDPSVRVIPAEHRNSFRRIALRHQNKRASSFAIGNRKLTTLSSWSKGLGIYRNGVEESWCQGFDSLETGLHPDVPKLKKPTSKYAVPLCEHE